MRCGDNLTNDACPEFVEGRFRLFVPEQIPEQKTAKKPGESPALK